VECDPDELATRAHDDAPLGEPARQRRGVGIDDRNVCPAGGPRGGNAELLALGVEAVHCRRHERPDVGVDAVEVKPAHQLEPGVGGVEGGDRRGTGLEAASLRGEVEEERVEGHGIHPPEPPGELRWALLGQPVACVEEGHTGQSQQVLHRAGDEVVTAELSHVHGLDAESLVGVDEAAGTRRPGHCRDLGGGEPGAAGIGREWDRHQPGALVDGRQVIGGPDAPVPLGHVVHHRAPGPLCQPDVGHGRNSATVVTTVGRRSHRSVEATW
jgi:hypothetical protein